MKTLQQIAEEYDTDKASHGYCEIYEKKMGLLRDKPIKILEIGVFYGASLRTWREYFTKAEIHGIDIRLDRCKNINGVSLHEFDVGNHKLLEDFARKYGPWDIIIDDASHTMKHQQNTFDILWSSVNPDGFFVIEDLHTSFPPKLESYSADMSSEHNRSTTYSMVECLKEQKEFSSKYLKKDNYNKHLTSVEHVTIWVRQPAQFSYELSSNNNSATSIIQKKRT